MGRAVREAIGEDHFFWLLSSCSFFLSSSFLVMFLYLVLGDELFSVVRVGVELGRPVGVLQLALAIVVRGLELGPVGLDHSSQREQVALWSPHPCPWRRVSGSCAVDA